MSQTLKTRLAEDIKTAMRARDSGRLETLRFLQAAIKQREVDERTELGDAEAHPHGAWIEWHGGDGS